jgi:hypothetical protein
LSPAPQAAGASAGLSPAPQAAGASAGLSPAPHALPQEAAAFVSLFQSAKFESAIIFSSCLFLFKKHTMCFPDTIKISCSCQLHKYALICGVVTSG